MTIPNHEKSMRCTRCRAEFSQDELRRHFAKALRPGCPSCGTTGLPMAIAEDVTIRINWHELRILTIWASNWASEKFGDDPDQSREALAAILRELDAQRPEGAAPLTLAGEVQHVADSMNRTVRRDEHGHYHVERKEQN